MLLLTAHRIDITILLLTAHRIDITMLLLTGNYFCASILDMCCLFPTTNIPVSHHS